MKRNFDAVHMNHEGRPVVTATYKYDEANIPEINDKGSLIVTGYEPITMRVIALKAVGGRWKGDENMTIAQAKARTVLYDKLLNGGEVYLGDDEPNMILDCMLRQGLDPVVIGRMAALLEPK